MENQIDRDRILADEDLKREFKAWLLDPTHLAEFDRGTLLIPEKFLATGAIAATPVGLVRIEPAAGIRPVAGRGRRGRLGVQRERCGGGA